MTNKFSKSKLLAAGIGILMAIVLTVGGTFAWLILSKQPQAENMAVQVKNSTILEIAQAYPDNYLTGPPEVSADDFHKTRIIDGQTVKDQGVWGQRVDVDTFISLQEPATFDNATASLSTAKYDWTGRTDGFQPLVKQDIDEHGIVYYTREANDGNYRGEDGYIHTASSSVASPNEASPSSGSVTPATTVKCAGGIAVWMRSNQPTSEEVFLKGLSISQSDEPGKADDPDANTDSDILGVVVTTYHLNKSQAAKDLEKSTGVLQEGELEPFNYYFAEKTDEGYVCTLFSGDNTKQMQPGELYLVEIVCYIEGDRDNLQGNNAAVSGNMGESRDITFEEIECKDVLYAAKVTAQENATRNNGWFAEHTTLTIQLFGTSQEIQAELGSMSQLSDANIMISYKLTPEDDPTDVIEEGTFNAFNSSNERNKQVLELDDGEYSLTVMTTRTDASGQEIPVNPKYYTVGIGESSMVNTVEDSITVRVDTIRPTATAKLSDCGCTGLEENGYTYHNHDVTVVADVTENNLSNVKIGGRKVTPETVDQTLNKYQAKRLYTKAGDYTADVVATDLSGKTNDATITDTTTGKKVNEVKFIIDKKGPEIKDVKWAFVNSGPSAQVLRTLTGSMFFNKAVLLQADAEDPHISEMGMADGNGSLAATVNDVDETHLRASVELPMNYSGEITITAKDKAGNIGTLTTETISITNGMPETSVSADGHSADASTWYDVTYHLTAAGSNATRVTGFEYSYNGSDWATFDRHVGDVYYRVSATTLENDTVTIYCEDYKTASGNIYFRAVTDIVTDESGGNTGVLKGVPKATSYNLRSVEPTKPVVAARYHGLNGAGNYTASTPVNGTIEYQLNEGTAYGLDFDHYEYSSDGINWYPQNNMLERTENGITYKVTGNYYENVTVSGTDGEDIKSQLYFRTVSTKASDSSKILHSVSTDAYGFEIDRIKPVLSEAKWAYVNEGAGAAVLKFLTGELFFNKKIRVQIEATDANISSITCDEISATNDKYLADKIVANVYVDTGFEGTLTFTAKDGAYNTAAATTSRLVGTGISVVESTFTDNDGHQCCRYKLSIPHDGAISSVKYEYQIKGYPAWYQSNMGSYYYTYYFDSDYTNACDRDFIIMANAKGTRGAEEFPTKVRFRVTVKDNTGKETTIESNKEYEFARQWP